MKFTKRNLRNIACIFEEKTGVDLNPAHRTRPRPSIGKLVLVAAVIAFCLAVPGCARELFSPLHGDELSLGGTYEGNGIVSVQVGNDSDKDLKFQKQLKLMCWSTSEEVEKLDGEIIFQNTSFPAHSSGTMTIDISKAYDIEALEQGPPELYYFLLTNNDFFFGHDWMCSFRFRPEEAPEEISPPEDADLSLLTAQAIEDMEEELRFYFADAYAGQAMSANEKNTEYMRKVQELLAQFNGTVVPPADSVLTVDKTPEGVVFDEAYPMERQYELVGEYRPIIDGYGRIVAGFNSPTGYEHTLTLESLLPTYQGEVGGGVTLPLIYLFTYEVPAIQEDSYAFLYGRLLSFGEMEQYKVYQDEQYAVYEMTDLFYTDLDAYIDYFLTTREDIYFDEQIRRRVHNIYDYYRDKETLGSQFYYNLPE